MLKVSTLLCASALIAVMSMTAFAGSITTLRTNRTGSITTLSRGSITTLRSGSITTLRSGSITTLATPQTRIREESPLQEIVDSMFTIFLRALW